MKVFLKRVGVFLLKHKIFSSVLLLELACLVGFGAFLCSKPIVDFHLANQDGSLLVLNSDDGEVVDLGEVGTHFGGYETSVDYQFSPKNPDSSDEIASGGYIAFMDGETEADRLNLTELNTDNSGRLYVGKGHNTVVRVVYNGGGSLEIKSIHLVENVGFRYTLWGAIMLVFLGINTVYLFCRSKGFTKNRKVILGGLAVIVIVASLPFLTNVLFKGHDLSFHLERIVSVSSELENGNFPVRMMTDMANEHAYPNSIFYCDIFLYIPAIMYSLFIPLQICYQAYCILINIVTCVIAFYCLRGITKNTKVSLVGSTLYTLSTYRITNLALRAAIGEMTAMAFLPLIILGLYKIYTTEKPRFRDWAPLGIGLALIAMCHIISLELCLGFMAIFCLIVFKKTFRKERLLSIFKAALVCLGLSAWFVVPLADYMVNQPVDVVTRGANGFYSHSGVYPVQYLNPLDAASTEKDANNVEYGMQGEIPLGLGVSILVGLIVVGWFLITHRHDHDIGRSKYLAALVLFLIGMLALFLGSYLFPWETILTVLPEKIASIIATIQFPFRFLTIATVSFVFAIAITLSCLDKTVWCKYKDYLCILLVALVGFSSIYYMFSIMHTKLNYTVLYADVEDSLQVGWHEYIPAGATVDVIRDYGIKGNDQQLVINDYKKDDDKYLLSYNNQGDRTVSVTLPVFAYRYFEASDGSGEKIDVISSDDEQLLVVNLPPSTKGEVVVRFNPPWFWHVAEAVSVGTLVFCSIECYRTRKKTR